MPGGAGMDSRRAHRKAVRHRNIRVIVIAFVAVFLVAAVVHLRSHWSVPGAWAAVLLSGVVVGATLIVLGVVVGRRRLHS
jgi:protein-S-isoprenylcysteine O-methyltransferase Ste14